MSQLTLWKLDGSPPANAVRTLAEILDLKLDLINIDFVNKEHKSPEYMKLNPLGTIPLLKDGDFILADSHAIMKYLLTKYGSDQVEKLYPSDVKTRALVDQSLFLNAAVLFIKVKVVALPTIYEGLKGPTSRHIQDIQESYRVVEAYIGDKSYIAADHLTIADIAVGSTVAALNAIHELDMNEFPRTRSWLERLLKVQQFDKYAGNGAKTLGDLLHAIWAKANAE